jgi:DNA replication protein DnaC
MLPRKSLKKSRQSTLHRLTNEDWEYIEQVAKQKQIKLAQCPTCQQFKQEVVPGIWEWPASTYRLDDKEHPCNCEEQVLLRRYYLLADIPSDYWRISEEQFFGDSKALQHIKDYLKEWPLYKGQGMGLTISSPTMGTGKTTLSTLMAKRLIHMGERVLFVPFQDIMHLWDTPYEKREKRVQKLRNTPVLILDDVIPGITSEKQGEYFAYEFETLIRFRTSGSAVTIVTTNLKKQEMVEHYFRVSSLLADRNDWVYVDGEDVRSSGEGQMRRIELMANHEVAPIV